MSSFGRQSVATIGSSVQLSADGAPERKVGGITVDWSSVTAAGANTTLNDGVSILAGDKYLRYGQVMTRITGGEINTITLTAATGGTFVLRFQGESDTSTTGGIAYNATNATLTGVLEALTGIGTGNVATSGSAGGPYTVTFVPALGDVTLTAYDHLIGTGHAIAVAVTSVGGRTDKYGPYDPDAVDGRQTLTQGDVVLINETIKENDPKSDHPDVIVGGQIWLARLIATSGSASLANGPTLTNIRAALRRIQEVTGG